jgi:outer membrane protein assembly factor BamB
VVGDGTVYFGDGDGSVHAVDARTGDRRWKRRQAWSSGSSLLLSGNRIYANGYNDSSFDGGRVFALDAGSGRELWQYPTRAMLLGEVLSGRKFYFFRRTSEERRSSVDALDTATGNRVWSHRTGIVWELTAHGDVVYYVASSDEEPSPQLHALNARTGDRLWKVPFAEEVHDRPESLTVIGGVLYAVGDSGIVSAHDPGDGRRLWSAPTGLRDLGDSELPVVADGLLYVSGKDVQEDHGQVFAIDAKTGAVKWRRDLPAVSSSPTVSSGTVYVSTKSGELHLLNAGDGAPMGKVRLADDREPNAVVSGGIVYFGAGDGHLRAATITR